MSPAALGVSGRREAQVSGEKHAGNLPIDSKHDALVVTSDLRPSGEADRGQVRALLAGGRMPDDAFERL